MNEEGVTKPIEVIGASAYYGCGDSGYRSKTRSILVTRQVKIIKTYGFGYMNNIESFRIEEGSVLETIEKWGLDCIGRTTGKNDASKRGTLVLPSTLFSVFKDGISTCNLFNVIIYCGTHSLTNSSELYDGVEETKVKVTNQYSGSTIFCYDALKDSPIEVESNCSIMEHRVTQSLELAASSSPSKILLRKTTPRLATLFFALLPPPIQIQLLLPLFNQHQLLHLLSFSPNFLNIFLPSNSI